METNAASASVYASLTISFTSSQSASWLLSNGCHGPFPAIRGGQVESELVQDSQDGLIDEVIDGLRMIVKCRNGRKNHDAHARELQHMCEVNVTQRRFADGQHQFAAFFEHHVGRTVNEGVAVTLRNGGERPDATRAYHHALSYKRTAGDGRTLILRRIMLRRHLLDLLYGIRRLVDQRARSPVAENQMRLHLCFP